MRTKKDVPLTGWVERRVESTTHLGELLQSLAPKHHQRLRQLDWVGSPTERPIALPEGHFVGNPLPGGDLEHRRR